MALLHVNCFSDVLGKCVNLDVILPQRTKEQIGLSGAKNGGKYPTLYLLHGMSDDHTCWNRRTSIDRYVSSLGIAVVMPNADLSWYTDTAYGQKYWQYMAEELPALCREFFPNMSDKREETFVAGNSMGGYGGFQGQRTEENIRRYICFTGCRMIILVGIGEHRLIAMSAVLELQ